MWSTFKTCDIAKVQCSCNSFTNDTHFYTWDFRFLHGAPFGLMATHFFVEVVDESLLKVHAMPTCSFKINIVTMLGDEETNIWCLKFDGSLEMQVL